MFKEVKADFNFSDSELNTIEFWKNNRIFDKSVNTEGKKGTFLFYEGPPTANGTPHAGHVLTRVIKDLFPRYKTMSGYKVRRKAGWDTHGLPVEIEVEKKLGINGKKEIEQYGIKEFVEECRASVFTNMEEWNKITERIGFWIDLDDPYVTFHKSYINSVWWALSRIWDKGLLYKGFKILPYCPRCGTALSSHEVGLGYKTVSDPSLYVKFKIKGEENKYFLAWTTTPWTLISNAALVVGPDFDYVTVEYEGEDLVLAEKLVHSVFEGREYSLKDKVKGTDLAGIDYEPLYLFEKPGKRAYYVIKADFVSLEDGTGIVHSAPAFGEDDYRTGLEYDLPLIQLVDTDGTFKQCVEPWKGVFVKDADPEIIKDLEKRALLFRQEKYEHEYPFCWRCESPLLYYARSSWFIKTTAVKEKLLESNDTIGWYPDNIRTGRFGDFLKNNVDWALSRERYWGTPLNIWECSSCSEYECIASFKDLQERNPDIPDDLDLHRPYIDEVILACKKCGSEMKRVPEVIDCWFDSGAMPFAQWGYPYQNEDVFKEGFPCDFISEAIDQTRGWFYSLLAISVLLFGRSPYKNCLVLGHVCDREGKKMSKRLGNYTDPWDVLQKQGADAMRWYFYSSNHPWVNVRFFEEAITDSQKDFLMTLKNIYSFFIIYANIDGFVPSQGMKSYGDGFSSHPDYVPVKERELLDRWIISFLNSTIGKVRDRLDNYDVYGAAGALAKFVDGLSNWYVRRSRNRFWKSEKDSSKTAAYWTLYESLDTICRALAPFIPFLTEEMYQNLVQEQFEKSPQSVHLTQYPEVDENLVHKELMNEMSIVRAVVVAGRGARNSVSIKTRQPLKDVTVIILNSGIKEMISSYARIIKEELNVKEVIFADNTDEYVIYEIKPNYQALGPRLGKRVQTLGEILAGLSQEEKRNLARGGSVEVEGETVALSVDDLDVRITGREGYVAQEGEGIVVVLNTELTDDLVEEGIAREIINRIQNVRKSKALAYESRIKTTISGDESLKNVIEKYNDIIKKETLSIELCHREEIEEGKEWEIDGKTVSIAVEKV